MIRGWPGRRAVLDRLPSTPASSVDAGPFVRERAVEEGDGETVETGAVSAFEDGPQEGGVVKALRPHFWARTGRRPIPVRPRAVRPPRDDSSDVEPGTCGGRLPGREA